MAWRIEDSVIRGEIDNRTRGVVTGKVWLHGLDQPLDIQLQGNACSDLAGCFLEFKNPRPPVAQALTRKLHLLQRGVVGDLTASRKVRIPDVPLEEFYDWDPSKGPCPEHIGNCLYLEWFSETNGRVVIEAAEWQLNISAPEWRLTPAEDEERSRTAAEGMNDFVQHLNDAIEKEQRGQKDPEERWDEYDYEKFLRESDARNEKYRELLDKYKDDPDAEAKINAAMGWDDDEEFVEALSECEDVAEICEDEPDSLLDPAREGIDWIRTRDGDIRHPLQHRCTESALGFWQRIESLLPLDDAPEAVRQFLEQFQVTSAKLAGALCGVTTDSGLVDPAFIVAYLKRALAHLQQALAGLEAPDTHKALPAGLIQEARQELFEIRESILHLMDQFRGRRNP